MTKITIKDLQINSKSYDINHGITQEDADKATELYHLIKATRNSNKPTAGDIMVCQGPTKKYLNGHIEGEYLTYHAAICTQPYVPFVTKIPTKKPKVVFNTSGGYWFCIPEEELSKVKYEGKQDKLFKAWGHNSACANGAFYFSCPVNVWSYYSEKIY